MDQFKQIFTVLLMLTLGVGMMSADEQFNPSNPPEPSASYRLTVRCEPEGVGYVSGAGRYRAGEWTYINTSSSSVDYRFKRWLIDGVEYYDNWSYIGLSMPQHDVEVVAEYEFVPFDPESPSDPAARYMRRVYVQSEPAGVCSFNIGNGERFEQGSQVYVQAMPNPGYVFDGWYINRKKVADSSGFYYTVPDANTTLTVRYTYNPDNPADPTGGQADVDNSGFVEATGITIDADKASVNLKETCQLTASILPANATYQNIYWYSSDPLVARVSQTGLVTGESIGSAVITATNGRYTATCTVNVHGDYMPGDVNGDGNISVLDITMIVSHILGTTPANFSMEAADVSGDGNISVLDITQIVNIILHQ